MPVAIMLLTLTATAADNPDSEPYCITPLGDFIFFTARTDYYGRELWKYDPQRDEVSLVKDILPGSADGVPREYSGSLPIAGGAMIFPCNTIDGRVAVWRSDGTTGGTSPLMSVTPERPGVLPHFCNTLTDEVFFDIEERDGFCLYLTDGTADGTRRALPGCSPGWSAPAPPISIPSTGQTLVIRRLNSELLQTFKFNPASREMEPVDSTLPGGFEIAGPPVSMDANTAVVILTINRRNRLAVLRQPGQAFTLLRPELQEARELIAFGGRCYFQGTDEEHGVETWVTDGTEAGTRLFVDLLPGPAKSDPYGMTVAGELMYFSAQNDVVGRELYCTDGTPEGTRLVRDLLPGPEGSHPYRMHNVKGRAIFGARHAELGEELWISDGTEAGTRVLKDIWPGAGYGEPYHFQVIGEEVYFSANDGANGRELWRSDGTSEGTWMIADINPAPRPLVSGNPSHLLAGEEQVLFTAEDYDGSPRLWASDGTTEGTVRLAEEPLPEGAIPILLHEGVALVTASTENATGILLRLEDGAFTAVLPEGFTISMPPAFKIMDNRLFLSGSTPDASARLWVLEPPYHEARPVHPLDEALPPQEPGEFLAVNGVLYFSGTDERHGRELWLLEEEHARLVADLAIGEPSSSPSSLTWYRDQLWCVANDGIHGPELWQVDPRSGDARLLLDISPLQTIDAPAPARLTVAGDHLFFTARSQAEGVELWHTDGSTKGTHIVRDITLGPGSSFPGELTAFNGTLWFAASSPADGRELWISDGTRQGTWPVRDFMAGSSSGAPAQLTVAGGALLFEITTGMYLAGPSRELHRALDTKYVELVAELWPGPPGSEVAELTPFQNTVLFRANDGLHGAELWRCDPIGRTAQLVKDLLPQPRLMPRRR